jgi:CO dehydrogenase maturation factor
MNQAKGDPDEAVLDIIRTAGIDLAGVIQEDDTVYQYDLKGRPTVEIPEDNPAVRAAYEIFEKIID